MIKKAIILAAGEGRRLRPLTLSMPKEMIRVGAKPAIEHAINVLESGGIKEILVIVGRKKGAVIDYLGSGERLGVDISYKVQEEPKGTACAVYLGKNFVGEEDFAVIYGDNYLKPYKVMKEIVKFHEEKRTDATLALYPVKDPRRYGIVKVNADNKVLVVIEKPTLKEARSYKVRDNYLSIAGLLILKPSIFNYIKETEPGKENEIWLTDSIKLMMKAGYKIHGCLFEGTRFDVGTFKSLLEADKLEQERPMFNS